MPCRNMVCMIPKQELIRALWVQVPPENRRYAVNLYFIDDNRKVHSEKS
ncbi:hypothetical protein PP427_gp181 [Salmonella phage KM16]|nr:hypothetical protein PP427_gp181 [Salmonella phage KM16]